MKVRQCAPGGGALRYKAKVFGLADNRLDWMYNTFVGALFKAAGMVLVPAATAALIIGIFFVSKYIAAVIAP